MLIDNRQLIRNIKRGEIKLKCFKSSNIPITLKKIRTMLFDNGSIKKIDNLFFCVNMFRIFDKKDIFFEVFKISSDFKVVHNLIHFLYRKIFGKRRFEE
jgi:hypothetical protein